MNLPSIMETVILYIIRENYGASGYRIRRIYTQSTGKYISLGTLVPMLHRFENEELVVKEVALVPLKGDTFANYWHMTQKGIEELETSLHILDKLLPKRTTEEYSGTLINEPVGYRY